MAEKQRLEFTEFQVDGYLYRVNPPLEVEVTLAKKHVYYKDLSGMLSECYTDRGEQWQQSLKAGLAEDVAFVYEHYGLAPDETLAVQAKKLKSQVLTRVTRTPRSSLWSGF